MRKGNLRLPRRFIAKFRAVMYRLSRHGRKFCAKILIVVGITIILLIFFTAARFRKLTAELALGIASDTMTTAINDTVSELMADGTVGMMELVTFEKDNNGSIAALSTNMEEINLLQAAITNAVIKRFSETDIMTVSVPIGSVTGTALLSGRGPRIEVKLLSVSNIKTSFRNEFTSAGINQTRHRVFMDVEVTFGVVLAGYEEWETIVTEVGVAETVIVGGVPETYAAVCQPIG